MSYLLQHVRRPVRGRTRFARVDERKRLNLPEFDGGASVRAFVEDTSRKRFRRRPPEPRLRLRISDCINEIALEFGVATPEARENALFKIDTLLDALGRFRDGLAAEADLYESRERRAVRA
jgi:hypothetical protein